MKIKNIIAYACVFSILTAVADAYEVTLITDPAGADAYLYLVHPFNNPTSDYYGTDHNYYDCQPTLADPDWGVKGWDGDDPHLNSNWTAGARKITANTINDPGNCLVKVAFLGSGSAECTVTITNWPGVEPVSFTKTLGEGDTGSNAWIVTSLPCAKDIGMEILKAKQNRSTYKLKIKSTFNQLTPLNEASNYFRASLDSSEGYSLRMEEWMHFTIPQNIKIRKGGAVAKFGKPVQAVIKALNTNKISLKGQGMNMYQNRSLRLFIALGGQSGYERIYMDDKAKYKITN